MFDSCPTCWTRRQNPHIQYLRAHGTYFTYLSGNSSRWIQAVPALVPVLAPLFGMWYSFIIFAQASRYTVHRRRIYTEEKAKVVAASWRTEFFNVVPRSLYCTYALGRFEEQAEFHPILQFVLVQRSLFFNISFYKIAKARQKMEENLSPKKQGRPLPTLLYKSFFFYTVWYRITITITFFFKENLFN